MRTILFSKLPIHQLQTLPPRLGDVNIGTNHRETDFRNWIHFKEKKEGKRKRENHLWRDYWSFEHTQSIDGINEKENAVDTQIVTDPLALADRLLDLSPEGGYSLEERQHTVQT